MKNIKEYEFSEILEKITGMNKNMFSNLERDSKGTFWHLFADVVGLLKGAGKLENQRITTSIGIKVKKHANNYYFQITVCNPFDVNYIYFKDYELLDYDLIKNTYIPEILCLLENEYLFLEPKVLYC